MKCRPENKSNKNLLKEIYVIYYVLYYIFKLYLIHTGWFFNCFHPKISKYKKKTKYPNCVEEQHGRKYPIKTPCENIYILWHSAIQHSQT